MSVQVIPGLFEFQSPSPPADDKSFIKMKNVFKNIVNINLIFFKI